MREHLRPYIALACSMCGEQNVEDRLDATMNALFEAFQAHYLAASDCQPHELPAAVSKAADRFLADAGAVAANVLSLPGAK
jgi:hypothetical protein